MRLVDWDIWELEEYTKNRKIVAFGSGRMLQNYWDVLAEHGLENRFLCLLDNAKEKEGNTKLLRSTELTIYSPERFIESDIASEKIVLLISSTFVAEIVEQLDKIDYFDNIEACYLGFVQAKTRQKVECERFIPDTFRKTSEMLIPKVIHYCWFGGKEIPEKNKKWMESWKKYCPDYEIIEWNETNYDIGQNDFMKSAYESGKWGFVPDYARLDIIQNYGGIYLDTDVELIKNLDELLYQEAFAGVDSSMNISFGLGFGACKNNKVVREMLDYYNNISFDLNNLVAAPTIMKPVFEKYHFKYNGDYQNVGNMTIYPEKVLSGKDNCTGLIMPTDYTYAIHHYDGSWNDTSKINRNVAIQQLYSRARVCSC